MKGKKKQKAPYSAIIWDKTQVSNKGHNYFKYRNVYLNQKFFDFVYRKFPNFISISVKERKTGVITYYKNGKLKNLECSLEEVKKGFEGV